MTGTAIRRCLSDTDKALRTETPQGLFLYMCAGGSSAPISPLAGFATKKAGDIFCCFKQDSQGVNLQSCFAHRARFGSSPSTMSTKKSKPFDLLQVGLVELEPMVSLRSVSLEIVVQRRYRLLRSFSRQACASLLRPPGALRLRPLHDVNVKTKKQAFRLASSGISRARTYDLHDVNVAL